jgi:hypothetical protein
MKQKLIYFFLMLILLASCSDELPTTQQQIPQVSSPDLYVNEDDELKLQFGKALASAIADNKEIRELLKTEALKMFDADYDILYHLVKDSRLSDGKTFRDHLLNYYEDQTKLTAIENKVPLLTIFVPELPEKTFSAELWNPVSDIPVVGITSQLTNDVRMVDSKGEVSILSSDLIPGYPVVVIKENERVRASQKKGATLRSSDNRQFEFLADCFNGPQKADARLANWSELSSSVISGWFATTGHDAWQRDYVYYGMNPESSAYPAVEEGTFHYDNMEHITTFKMVGTPQYAFSKISDQTSGPNADPKTKTSTSPNSGWTGGFFEFKVKVLLNARNGIGAEYETFFAVGPNQLFTLTYTKSGKNYIPSVTGFAEAKINLPLFHWNLYEYATTIKIEIEEVDATGTTTTTTTVSANFVNNFEINAGIEEPLKVGLKFGQSSTITMQQQYQRSYTEGNDQLGEVIVNFADDIILGNTTGTLWGPYITREYATGFYSISVEPVRVQ